MPMIRVEPPEDKGPSALAANAFYCSRMDGDIQLIVAYVDVRDVATEIERRGGKIDEDHPITARAETVQRFVMSARGLANLKEVVDTIYSALVEAGQLSASEKEQPENG